jgi:hypothetical protein
VLTGSASITAALQVLRGPSASTRGPEERVSHLEHDRNDKQLQVDNAPWPAQSVSTALDGLAINRWPQFTRQAGQ